MESRRSPDKEVKPSFSISHTRVDRGERFFCVSRGVEESKYAPRASNTNLCSRCFYQRYILFPFLFCFDHFFSLKCVSFWRTKNTTLLPTFTGLCSTSHSTKVRRRIIYRSLLVLSSFCDIHVSSIIVSSIYQLPLGDLYEDCYGFIEKHYYIYNIFPSFTASIYFFSSITDQL